MRTSRRSGLTLIELLVAFTVFALFVGALVALGTAGLNTWQEGEYRKDIYDRSQRLLDRISDDLRNTWVDEVWHQDAGGRDLQHAAFIGDTDRNRLARLRFVRSGRADEMKLNPDMRMRPPTADLFYTDLWEVLYCFSGPPEKAALTRAVRYFDRRTGETLLNGDDIADSGNRFVQSNAEILDDGVLFLGFRYWTQYSSTWFETKCWLCENREHADRQQYAGPGKCQARTGDRPCNRELRESPVAPLEKVPRTSKKLIGPSLVWDSSRTTLENRWIHKKTRRDLNDPDFVYPEIVQVTIVVESTAPEVRGVRLLDALEPAANQIRVNGTKMLADGPAMVKIDAEWISYEAKTNTDLLRCRRGQRGTTAAAHNTGSLVRHGQTFVRDIHLPVYQEAVR